MPGRRDAGNFVAEWFGHRVYPTVTNDPRAVADMRAKRCPFLSDVVGVPAVCVKSPESSGVCTVSSIGGSARRDFLVCPHRMLERPLLETIARRLFSYEAGARIALHPAPELSQPAAQTAVVAELAAGARVLVYLQAKLGGEISLSATARSPELSFDTTLVELTAGGSAPGLASAAIGRYGIVEAQTMDYHGTYRHAVKNLEDALRLHDAAFPDELARNPRWLAERMEGPNIANVFKRTFYQMMFKFQLAGHGACAGTALAIPAAVWDSWQRHFAAPDLRPAADGTLGMWAPGHQPHPSPSWIYVFELDAASPATPNPIAVRQIIATDAESLGYFALKAAPEAAIAAGGSIDNILNSIHRRLSTWWPAIAVALPGA